jgi:hypothetical protein
MTPVEVGVKKRMSQLRDEALREEGEILTMAELASRCLDFAAAGCEDESRKVADIGGDEGLS